MMEGFLDECRSRLASRASVGNRLMTRRTDCAGPAASPAGMCREELLVTSGSGSKDIAAAAFNLKQDEP
jgi:hypothetical protein